MWDEPRDKGLCLVFSTAPPVPLAVLGIELRAFMLSYISGPLKKIFF